MLELAGPLVLAEIGWMLMGIVDIMMVGRMPNSASAIGAASIGGMMFYTVAIFAGGLLLGMDTLVSRSFGAGDIEDCNRTLLDSLYLILGLSPILMVIVYLSIPVLRHVGIHPLVMNQAAPFMQAIMWSMAPLGVYFTLRHYLQCMNHVKIIMFTLISANLVNLAGNWAFVFGHMGLPAFGVAGSGWSTCISRIYMAAVLILYTLYLNRRDHLQIFNIAPKPNMKRIREIIGLGLPAASQIGLELAVFAIAAALIGKLGPLAIAGHQVALSVVAFTYMVPLGMGSAAAVRVGQAIGRGDNHAAGRAGWVAIAMGAGFMSCAAVALLTVPKYIVRVFTADPAVIEAGAALLFIAAFFQLFDGLQAVATGALRGAGETRIPMFTFLFGYWVAGLPLGYFLCFNRGWGARGFWTGFCVALITVGILLIAVWHRKVKRLQMALVPAL